jgi:hypothetical protein
LYNGNTRIFELIFRLGNKKYKTTYLIRFQIGKLFHFFIVLLMEALLGLFYT